jgi:hypothetical protein
MTSALNICASSQIKRCPYTLSPFPLSPGHIVSRSLCPRSLCPLVTLSPRSLCPQSLCPPVTLSPSHFVPRKIITIMIHSYVIPTVKVKSRKIQLKRQFHYFLHTRGNLRIGMIPYTGDDTQAVTRYGLGLTDRAVRERLNGSLHLV